MDLSGLQALLAGLGPWGLLIGAAIPFILKFLQARLKATPTPGPVPVPVPDPVPTVPSNTPIRDAARELMLKLLGILMSPKAAQVQAIVEQDMTAAEVQEMLAKVSSLLPKEELKLK